MNIDQYLELERQRREREQAVNPNVAWVPPSGQIPTTEPQPTQDFDAMINELAGREAAATVAPQATDTEVAGSPKPIPQTDPMINGLPRSVWIRGNIANSKSNWSNFFQGLGRRGRNFRADPMAGEKARSGIVQQYLSQKNADEMNRQNLEKLALEKRRTEAQLAPKPVDPLERMSKIYGIKKQQQELAKGEREAESAGSETERKQELVSMINGAMGKEVASISMDEKTLNGMASDIGLDPLKLRRAKAAGGGNVSGKNIAYNAEAQPRLSSLVAKAAEGKSKFLSNPNDAEAYKEVVNSPDLTAKQKREIIEQQGWDKEIERTQDRLYGYADETLKKISAPENGIAQMLKAITDLRETIEKYPDVPGWGEISSAANAFGPLGQWAVDLKQFNDPAARDVMQAVRGYNEAYRRMYSGAAINKDEKADFASQLGAGAFSNPQALIQGVNRAEKILRDGVWNTFSTIDDRVWDEYIPRAKSYLPREKTVTRKEAQSVADKYNTYTFEDNDSAFGDL